jgi:RNA-directed DNA polymerase
MEEALGIKCDKQGQNRGDRALVRYADDFVVCCTSRAEAEKVVDILKDWLAVRGLRMAEDKTRIVHLTDEFDFLGFTVRHYSNVKCRTGTVLLITPSKDAVLRHREKLRQRWYWLKGKPAAAVVADLAPSIKCWANYYQHQVAKVTFKKLDRWMFIRECRWLDYNHPRKSRKWRNERYWGRFNTKRKDHWVFGDKRARAYLPKYQWTDIVRHVQVKGQASPDDPSLKGYWAERNRALAIDLPPSHQKIARNQNCVCPICGETPFNSEELQKDHVRPKGKDGKKVERYDNFSSCTWIVRSRKRLRSSRNVSQRANGCASGLLEPDALKGARPVLRGEGSREAHPPTREEPRL